MAARHGGPGRPAPVRPTDDEYAERVDYAYTLLARRLRTSEYKRLMRERFGDLDHRTLLGYLARARQMTLADAARGRDVLRAESLALCNTAIAAPDAKWSERLKAQERIDKLLGLELQLPPLEILCEHLGCTVDELRDAVAHVSGRTVPGPAATEADAPHAV